MSLTNVTGTITDPSTTPWAGAQVFALFRPPFGWKGPFSNSGVPYSPEVIKTTADGSGNFTLSVPDNETITPTGSKWQFILIPQAASGEGAQGQVVGPLTITGASQDITTEITSTLTSPVVNPTTLAFAYNDDEVQPFEGVGQVYFRVSDSTLRQWTGSAWVEVGGGGGGGFSVSGSPSAPHPAFVPIYQGGSPDTAVWGNLTAADILPAFAVTGFSGGLTVEIGASITNPTFGFSYTATPVSATLTNTDGIDSPFTLSSPFTSATLTGTFTHSTQGSTLFTIDAVDGSGDHAGAQQSFNWLPRNFAGVGTAGATGATASGNNADLTGATGTLNDAGLSGNIIGTTFGPLSPSGQKIYILTTTFVSVWHDAETGLGFAMNSPTTITFVNQNGASVSMFLYESSNLLTGTFEPQAVS